MSINKIVVTGGPCGGKTTGLEWIKNAFTEKGYNVLFVPETATELISSGVAPWTCSSNVEFQKCLMRLQLTEESVYEQAAGIMTNDNVLIVCDRGALCNKAYMTKEEFAQVMESVNSTEDERRESYGAVFHLVSTAKGAEEFYTTSNNSARTESIEEAAALDDALIEAWKDHTYHRIVDNTTGFEEKMQRLIAAISEFLEVTA